MTYNSNSNNEERVPGLNGKNSSWLRKDGGKDRFPYGYSLTDVDMVHNNFLQKWTMLLEFKSRMGLMPVGQYYNFMDNICPKFMSPTGYLYRAFLFIQFENEYPDDGQIFVNHKLITHSEYYRLLCGEQSLVLKYGLKYPLESMVELYHGVPFVDKYKDTRNFKYEERLSVYKDVNKDCNTCANYGGCIQNIDEDTGVCALYKEILII